MATSQSEEPSERTRIATLVAVDEKTASMSTSAAIPMMGLAFTMILLGLSNLPGSYGSGFLNDWTVYGVALIFGGVGELIVGILALRAGKSVLGTAFFGLGALFVSFVLMMVAFSSAYPIRPMPPAIFYGVSGFWFVCSLFMLTMAINAPKMGWGITGLFVLLLLAFVLLAAKSFQMGGATTISDTENWVVGGEIILTGLFAWLASTVQMTVANYRRKPLVA